MTQAWGAGRAEEARVTAVISVRLVWRGPVGPSAFPVPWNRVSKGDARLPTHCLWSQPDSLLAKVKTGQATEWTEAGASKRSVRK